jgi:hypothetical protein
VYAKKVPDVNDRWLGLSISSTDVSTYVTARWNLDTQETTLGSASSGFTFLSSSITHVGNGWYRCSVTGIIGSSESLIAVVYIANSPTVISSGHRGAIVYVANTWSGFYIWGAQVEVGSFPTSYIRTEASQVTRLADNALISGTNFSSWYNQDQGTVFVDTLAALSSGASAFVGFDSDISNRWRVGHTGGNSTNFLVVIGGSVVTSISRVAPLGFYNKSAASYGAGDNHSFVANASAPVTSANAGMPVVDKMTIGSAPGVATRRILIKKIAYYPQRITDSQMQALTQS